MSELCISRITTKGQVTVPLELRKSLNLREGDYVLFEKKGSAWNLRLSGQE